jgi:hypothetical protein
MFDRTTPSPRPLSPKGELIFTHIFGWTQGPEVRILALALGERVAVPQSRESQVKGYLDMLAHLTPPRRASDPSPGPRRLVKTPAAVHPLPSGEGKDAIPSLSPRETAEVRGPTAVSSERCGTRSAWASGNRSDLLEHRPAARKYCDVV